MMVDFRNQWGVGYHEEAPEEYKPQMKAESSQCSMTFNIHTVEQMDAIFS
jgi:hypothetical protein